MFTVLLSTTHADVCRWSPWSSLIEWDRSKPDGVCPWMMICLPTSPNSSSISSMESPGVPRRNNNTSSFPMMPGFWGIADSELGSMKNVFTVVSRR